MNRVMFIAADGLKKSGVPTLMLFEAKLLSKLGYKIDLIYFKKNDVDLLEEFKKVCDNIYYFGYKKHNSFKQRIGRYFEQPFYKKRFAKIVKENGGYDVIHSFAETRSYPFFVKALRLGIKKLILDNNSQEYYGGNFFDGLLLKKEKRFLRKHCFFKAATLDVLIKSYGSDINYQIINNPYDYDTFYYDSNFKEPNKIVLCHVASFSSNKNQLFSVELLKQLKEAGCNAKLLLLGFEHEKGYLEQIKNRINQLNVDKDVLFFDANHSVKNVFDQSSCLLLPSLKEANPLVLLEAQACGMICYCSNNVSLETNKGNCIFTPLDDVKLWSNKIASDWSSGSMRRTKCDLSMHSIDYQIEMYKHLYNL